MMDSKRFEEIVTCGVCFEFFNEDNRCPRILSCGHTFCHSCLEKLLVQSPTCPTCKGHIQFRTAELIPVNFIAKNMISLTIQDNSQSVAQSDLPERLCNTSSGKLESEGFCTEHSNNKELRCMDCESWICGVCGVLHHKGCRTLLVKEAYKELKEKVSQKVGKELEILKNIDLCILESLEALKNEEKKLIDDLNKCKIKIEKLDLLKTENSELCGNLKQLLTSAENSTDDNELSKAISELEPLIVKGRELASLCESLDIYGLFPPTIEDLSKLCEERPVFAVETDNENILYGKVTVNEGQIWVSSFQQEKPRGRLCPLKELLHAFSATTELPKNAFLKLTPNDGESLEVSIVIETDGTSQRRARNFILLCSALKGESFKGRSLDLKYFDSV